MPDAAPPALDLNDPRQVVASAWADQALWSEVANQLGNSIRRWRARSAMAGVAGMFLSLLAGSMAAGSVGQKGTATLGVLLLALVPFLQQRLLSADRVLAWTRARHVSELLKEAIFRHLLGALPPVALDDGSPPPDPTGPGNLVRRCRAIKRAAADLALLAATTEVQPRKRKTALTLADYLADRVEGQIAYYRKNGMAAGTEARQLQKLEFGLGLLTVLLGALAGDLLPATATPDAVQAAVRIAPLGPWLVLIGTATAAISSHIAGTRNLELAAKYFATQDLLKTLRDEWAVDPDRETPARVVRLVDEVERAIAAEHGGWVSDWAQAAQGMAPVAVAAAAGAAVAVPATAPAQEPAPAPEPTPEPASEPAPEPSPDAGEPPPTDPPPASEPDAATPAAPRPPAAGG